MSASAEGPLIATPDSMAIPQRIATTLLIFATTTGATFTILVAGGSGSLESPAVRVIYDAMAAITLIPWLIVAVFRPAWWPSSRLAPAILLVLAVFAISTVTSRVPRLSAEMLGYSVLLTELYLLLVALMRRPVLRLHLQRLALVMCVVVATLYLVQVLQAWLVWWDLVGHLAIPPLRPGYVGLFISPNPLATVVLTLAAFGLAANRFAGRVGHLVTLALLMLSVVTTLVTASRGAWLGAGLGLIAVAATALVAQPGNRRRTADLVRSRRGIIGLVIGLPLIAAGGVLAALNGRLSLEDGGYRAGFARASAEMFQSSPLTGVGPGTWGVLRAANTIPTDPDLYIPHAHSVYLQTVAEFGLGGVAVGLVVTLAIGLLVARAIRSGDPSRPRVGYSALFGVVLLAGQQYADMLMNVPSVLLALALPIAWLDATSPPSSAARGEQPRRRMTQLKRAVPIAAAVVTCLIVVGLARIEAVSDTATRAAVAASDGKWTEATSLSADAAAADPDVAIYQFQLGVSAANAGDLPLAEKSLATSAAADDFTYAWLNLAAVRWKLGDVPGTQEALARAERLGLQRMPVAVAAGWLHQQLGDQRAAIADYANAFTQNPTLAGDPFWSSPSGPPGGLDAILEKANQMAAPATRFQIDLVLGRIDLTRADLASLSASNPGLYGLIIPAWTGDQAAWAALQSEAARRPLDATPVSWARFVASHLGERDAVQRYAAWLSTLSQSDAGLPVNARIVLGSTEALPPYVLDRYGSLYRRLVPLAQVVSLLPQVVLQDEP